MTSSGLVKDPATGAFTLSPEGRNLSSLGGTATGTPNASTSTPSDAYNIFSKNLMGLLSSAQTVGNPAPLYKSREQMVNQSLNLSNPMNDTPYKSLFGAMSPSQSVNAQSGTQQAFQPGITSTTDQINADNQAMQTFNNTVQTAYNVTKPYEVGAGSSLITPSGDTVYQGGKYTPTFNVSKGIMDGFDAVTGTWASDQQTSVSTPQMGSQAGTPQIVGGVDFAGTNGAKPYASDPAYAHKVENIYNDIVRNVPNANSDPNAIDKYITNNAPNAPVTGAMITEAAHKYNVDPSVLTAVLNLESAFGTKGVGARTMNPGNVGNVDSGATSTMKSWQDGVNAAAFQLQRREVNNAGATAASQILPGIPLPSVDSNGNYVPTSNPLVNTAIDLVEGRQVPSMLKTQAGVPSTIYTTIADKLSMAKYGVPYSPADAEAAYKVRNSQPYQTYMLSAPNALRVIDQVIQHVQNIAKDHPFVVQSTGSGLLNSAALATLAMSGNSDAKIIQSLLAQSGDDIGKLLGSGSGSDFKIKLGNEIFNANGSVKQTSDMGNSISQNIKDKMSDYFKAGGVSGNTIPFTDPTVNDMKQFSSVLQSAKSGSSVTGGATNFSVTAPNGKVYTFKDKASLDAFKASANIQ